jgi:hypothetical protein
MSPKIEVIRGNHDIEGDGCGREAGTIKPCQSRRLDPYDDGVKDDHGAVKSGSGD